MEILSSLTIISQTFQYSVNRILESWKENDTIGWNGSGPRPCMARGRNTCHPDAKRNKLTYLYVKTNF